MAHVEPRMRFGEYEAVHFIAAGGMGETWGGVKLSLTKAVAIKVLRPHLVEDRDAQNRFFREGRISAALNHGNIVSVIDYGAHEDLLYLVMDRVDGVDLRTFYKAFLKKAKAEDLPPLLVAHIMGEVLEALRYAHARPVGGRAYGVIHRDIKPSNVLVSSEGQILVTDFGIARYASDETGRDHILGSPNYMAPEQAEGRACPQSDIFGVGGVGHYLLTGQHPIQTSGSRMDFTLAYANPIPPVERKDVPEQLREFLVRSLAFKLEDRFTTADEALSALDKLRQIDTGERWTTVLRKLYRSCVAPPKSWVTGYLQREDAGASFLLDHYWKQARARTKGKGTLIMPHPRAQDSANELARGEAEPSSLGEHMPWLWGEDDEDEDEPGADAEGPPSPEPSYPAPLPCDPTLPVAHRDKSSLEPPVGPTGTPVLSRHELRQHGVRSAPEGTERLPPPFDAPGEGSGTGTVRMPNPHSLAPAPVPVPPDASAPAGVAPASTSAPQLQSTFSGPRVPQTAPRRRTWAVVAAVLMVGTAVNLGLMAWDGRASGGAEPDDAALPGAVVAAPPAQGPTAGPTAAEQPSSAPAVEDDVTLSATNSASTRTETPSASSSGPESTPTEAPDVLEDDALSESGIKPSSSDDTPTSAPADADIEPEPEPKPEPKQKPKPRVMVLFFLKGATHGEIHIAGRNVPVDTVATLKLRPGYYGTNWRRKGETEWRNAGRVKIPELDAKSEYCEIRLEGESYRSIRRAMPSKRGAK